MKNIMTSSFSKITCIVAASVAVYAGAANANSPNSPEAAIARSLSRVPNMPAIEKITRLSGGGIYEVTTSTREVIYTDEKGELIIIGTLIDARKFKKDPKDSEQARLEKTPDWLRIEELKESNAFVHRRGNGKREIAVFTDPNCPHCRGFEHELLKLNNITIYYFPVKYLHNPMFPDRVERLWCAEDRLGAWRNWMLKGAMPQHRTCDTTAIEQNTELAKSLGIKGVPAVYQRTGLMGTGNANWQEVEQRLVPAK